MRWSFILERHSDRAVFLWFSRVFKNTYFVELLVTAAFLLPFIEFPNYLFKVWVTWSFYLKLKLCFIITKICSIILTTAIAMHDIIIVNKQIHIGVLVHNFRNFLNIFQEDFFGGVDSRPKINGINFLKPWLQYRLFSCYFLVDFRTAIFKKIHQIVGLSYKIYIYFN